MARLDGQRLANLMLIMLEVLRENRIGGETFRETFLRITGVQPNVSFTQQAALAGDGSIRTQQQLLSESDTTIVTGQRGGTLVDGFLKSSDENSIKLRELAGSYIDNLLNIVNRWSRLERGQQARRLQRLIGNGESAITTDVGVHIGQKGADEIRRASFDIAEVVRQIDAGLKDIKTSELNRTVGSLALEDNFFQLLLTQVTALIASVPVQEVGAFGGPFVKAIKEPLAGIDGRSRRLVRQRRAIETELALLQQQAALIVEGLSLEGTREAGLSLKQLLEALSVLTSLNNRNKVEYKCKDCVFFDTALGASRCTFSSDEGIGRETRPDFSCKETWGLIGNDFWTASEETVEKVAAALNITEEGP